MKGMTLNETISRLLKMEQRSQKEGYGGDAAGHAAQRHMLILLSKGKQKRHPTEYQLKLGRYMKEGKSIKEAHKLAKS